MVVKKSDWLSLNVIDIRLIQSPSKFSYLKYISFLHVLLCFFSPNSPCEMNTSKMLNMPHDMSGCSVSFRLRSAAREWLLKNFFAENVGEKLPWNCSSLPPSPLCVSSVVLFSFLRRKTSADHPAYRDGCFTRGGASVYSVSASEDWIMPPFIRRNMQHNMCEASGKWLKYFMLMEKCEST